MFLKQIEIQFPSNSGKSLSRKSKGKQNTNRSINLGTWQSKVHKIQLQHSIPVIKSLAHSLKVAILKTIAVNKINY